MNSYCNLWQEEPCSTGSLYDDDVVLFLRPSASDIEITLDILQLFGNASGLTTNLQKSSVLPIQCNEEDKIVLQDSLPCQVSEFPCKYLGVPLSPYKLTKAQAQPIIEKIADRLPSWKADLLTKAGRTILVQYVLTSMLVYILMALELPPCALKAIDKIRKGFLWKGRKDARGGHCLLAWPKVTRPIYLGVLAFLTFRTWDMPCNLGGYGCRKRTLKRHGPSSPSKLHLKSNHSLKWQLK